MHAEYERTPSETVQTMDPIWNAVRQEAETAVAHDPVLSTFLYGSVLNHASLEDVIIHRVSERLDHPEVPACLIAKAFHEMAESDPGWGSVLRVDIQVVYDRDAACERFIEPVLYFKGFHALQTHRLAAWLHGQGRKDFALYLQSRSSAVFQVDVNPAAKLGKGIFIDHATGVVIGATARVGDNVSILQGVTLGGTGKQGGDRHPKIGNGVLIGAGAKVLGNIEIGHCSRIASGSVVLKPVPANTTVAGVPARVVGTAGCEEPSRAMDHLLASSSEAEKG
ncbi:serine O-acetyltransferase [Pararhizobium mangrovi]|uniref:Serine acetyltransferase n=1 Tax=Pararhizobium mangrovi TaxID=2590452 RepID=A0A506UHX0_9HYPH|nr:serine O-acetyltransferase [Pararhizobium mangrovi]TPW32900.1 serine O-acetyltransferase [Pararhizobium mangrovi]